ncbi:beta strand repeat-containing protein, partial [Leptobacterium meishanense]|uniref:beta strand repeat-containing protein n=1 Tax=Leptobacterium meishanense TaxID=3128904 RepID=UPI0039B75452
SSVLDISQVTDKGVLLPNVALLSTTDTSQIVGVYPDGLLIYNTATAGVAPNDVTPGYYYWDGTINAGAGGWLRFTNANELQDLSIAGDALSLTGDPTATPIDLTPYLDNTDSQDLSLTGNTLSLTNDGTPVDLSGYVNTDAQDLSIAGDALSLTGDPTATPIDLTPYLDNTDSQDLSLTGNTLSLTNDGTPVDLSGYVNTDAQDLSIAGDALSLTGDPTATPIDLTPYLDNTDSQDLSLTGNTLSLTNDGTPVDLTPYLDTTGAQNGLSMNGNNVELGGALTQDNTTITFAGKNLIYDLNGAGNLNMNLTGTGDIDIQAAGAPAFFINQNGRVGIGTNTPQSNSKLQINGQLRILDGTEGINKVLTSDATGLAQWRDIGDIAGMWSLAGNAVAAGQFLGTTNNVGLLIRTNNINHLLITTNGRIEIYNTGESIFIGDNAGERDDRTLNKNTYVGHDAGFSNVIGEKNVAVGWSALKTTGLGDNTAIGYAALQFNPGENNTAVGSNAMGGSNSGNRNTAIGVRSLSVVGVHDNVAVGYEALKNNVYTSGNVAIGNETLLTHGNNIASDQGGRNTVIGHGIMKSVAPTASNRDNVAVGYNALLNANSIIQNTVIGSEAGRNILGGHQNIVIGYRAEAPDGNTNQQLSIGNLIYGTGLNGTGASVSSGRIGIGTKAPDAKLHVSGSIKITGGNPGEGKVLTSDANGLARWDNASLTAWSLTGNTISTTPGTHFLGTINSQPLLIRTDNVDRLRITNKGQLEVLNTAGAVFLGLEAGQNDALTTGSTFIGRSAGKANTTGSFNVAIGYTALTNNQTGLENIAIGYRAMQDTNAGAARYNVAIGSSSMLNNITGSQNIGIGRNTFLTMTDGTNNVAIGQGIMNQVLPGATVSQNTVVGVGSLQGLNFSGSRNIVLGFNSGDDIIVGNNNILIGNDLTTGVTGDPSSRLVIGNLIYGTDVSGTGGALSPGNVGISVKNPTAKLEVNGSFRNDNGWAYLGGLNANGLFPAPDNDTPGHMAVAYNTVPNRRDVSLWNTHIPGSVISNRIAFTFNQLTAPGVGSRLMSIQADGWVGIGTDTKGGTELLRVNGTIRASSATIATPDYVFDNYYEGKSAIKDDYEFKTLEEVEAFIKKEGHLPGIESAEAIKANDNSIDLVNTSMSQLEKIEELFLYTIEQHKKQEALEAENKVLKSELTESRIKIRELEGAIEE